MSKRTLVNILIVGFLPACLFLLPEANAQSYYFQHFGPENGLPFTSVKAIYQDSTGHLWLGGEGGLSKYDGISFTGYGPAEGLDYPFVHTVEGDGKGGLWIGTTGGLVHYADSVFVPVELPVLSGVYSLLSVGAGRVLAGTAKGLVYVDGSHTVLFEETEGQRIRCIARLPGGQVLAGGNRLWYFRNGELEPDTLWGITDVFSIRADRDTLYFGTAKGLTVITPGSVRNFGFMQGLPGLPVTAIIRKNRKALWVGTPTGMASFRKGTFTVFTIDENRTSNTVYSLFSDKEQNIWVTTASGLYKSSRTGFMNYTYKDGYEGGSTFAIGQEASGELWIATGGMGVFRFNGESFTRFDRYHGLADNRVYDVLADGNKIYFATASGVSVLQNGKFRAIGRHLPAYSLLISSQGKLVAGGDNSIQVIEDNKSETITLPFSSGSRVWALAETSAGSLLAGSIGGGLVEVASDGNVTPLPADDGFDATNISALLPDDSGVWIGTFRGLFYLDSATGNIHKITEREGLNSEMVRSLTFNEDRSELWIGTNKGMCRLDLAKYRNEREVFIRTYGLNDGYIGVESNFHGAFCDNKGTLWFGTVGGLIRYDRGKGAANHLPAWISIEKIQLFFHDTSLAQSSTLPYDQNHITFLFKGICLTNPEKVKYKFRLSGLSEQWSPPTSSRMATFSNLPPGSYVFEVVASNNEGDWNTQPASFGFSIRIPFWQTWWFRAILIAFIALVAYVLFRWRMNRIKQKSELEGKMEQLRLQALRSQMNPHFIFNAMNAVQHYINNNEKREANLFLSKFALLMRMVLANSQKNLIPLEDDLKALELYLELEKIRFEDVFNYTINVADDIDTWETLVPPMLVQPFAENAINHGFAGISHKGKLAITFSKQGNRLQIEITDNGVGREQARKNKAGNKHLHKPAAMGITDARLKAMSTLFNNEEIKVEITDLYNEEQKAAGTSAIIVIPLLFNP